MDPTIQDAPTISEARLNANRSNAQKSTGAKTPFGRAASLKNLNRTTHGMTAEEHCLPDEDPNLFQERLDEYTETYKPETGPERYQVLLAVRASIHLDRAERAEVAALRQQVLAAQDDHHEEIAAAVAKRIAAITLEHPETPGEIVDIFTALRATPQGCRAAVAEWLRIFVQLDRKGWLEKNQWTVGLYLLGKSPLQIFTEPMATDWTAAYIGALGERLPDEKVGQRLQCGQPPTMSDGTFERHVERMMATLPDPAGGLARLKAVAQAEVAALIERAKLLEAVAERDRQLAIERAHFDPSKDAALRLRYTTANRRALDGALETLKKLKAMRRAEEKAQAQAEPPPQPPTTAPETVAEPTATATAEAVPTGPSEPAGESHELSREPASPGPIAAECSAQTPRDNHSP
jgi:hypothetical protein